jgi:hypothetical protein
MIRNAKPGDYVAVVPGTELGETKHMRGEVVVGLWPVGCKHGRVVSVSRQYRGRVQLLIEPMGAGGFGTVEFPARCFDRSWAAHAQAIRNSKHFKEIDDEKESG